MKRSLLLAPLILCTACDSSPSLPDGPGGGENSIQVVVDGVEEDPDSLSINVSTSSRTLDLNFSLGVDPIKDAIDDEYGYSLQLELSRDALAQVQNGASITVSSSVSFGGIDGVVYAMDPAPEPGDLIQAIELRRSCFCAGDAGSHLVTGTVMLTSVSSAAIAGSVELRFEGDIPNSEAQQLDYSVAFDQAITP